MKTVDPVETNLYFWLGADGEAEEVTETEFENKQQEKRVELEDFLNVRIDTI